MNQKKTAYLGLFAAIAIIFRVCGIVDSVFCGNSGNETRACKSGGAFCAGEVYVERSGAGFHCENFFIIGFMFGSGLQYYV